MIVNNNVYDFFVIIIITKINLTLTNDIVVIWHCCRLEILIASLFIIWDKIKI